MANKEKKFTLADMVTALFEGEVIGEETSVRRRNQMRLEFFLKRYNLKIKVLSEAIKKKC